MEFPYYDFRTEKAEFSIGNRSIFITILRGEGMSVLIELEDDRSEKVQYDTAAYPIYIRRGLLSHYPDYAAPSHWHDDIELIAVLDGEMSYNVNGGIIPLHKGEGILVNSRQMHFGFSDAKAECAFICILLHPMLLCPTPACEQDFILPVIRNHHAPSIFLDPNIGWQRDILKYIHAMDAAKGQSTAPLKVQSAFAAIWALLMENLPPEDHAANAESGDLAAVRNMIGFIQKNYAHKISLRQIAISGAVGQSKCCELFGKFFGQSPNTYLNRYRLGRSLDLLRAGNASITEIALAVGFGSSSYFAEIFHKCFGMTPTEYRRQTSKA